MFYNPLWAYNIKNLARFKENFLCLNDQRLLDTLENKITFRNDFKRLFNFIPSVTVQAANLSTSTVESLFSEFGETLVFQQEVSSGGAGTFVVSENNFKHVLEHKNCKFIVSRYLENSVAINTHIVIFKKEVIVFPGSIQIVEKEGDSLLYKGGDYLAFRMLPEKNKRRFYDLVRSLAQKLQKRGFRGVCGIDALIDENDRLYLMEVNPRFQGSSNILDLALADFGYDSLFKINYEAFVGEDTARINLDLNDFVVKYSSYSIIKNDYGKNTMLSEIISKSGCFSCDLDGYDKSQKIDDNVYLYRLIFNSICPFSTRSVKKG